jgi:hypothetical protein
VKFLKSDCEKIWLFDAKVSDGGLQAGLVCFLPFCEDTAVITIKEYKQTIEVPKEARSKAIPVKICNARLLMLF